MSRLTKFAVVVWIKKTAALPALRDELIGLAADEPDESTEYEEMVDFHWGFDGFNEAESVAAALAVLGAHPDLVLWLCRKLSVTETWSMIAGKGPSGTAR